MNKDAAEQGPLFATYDAMAYLMGGSHRKPASKSGVPPSVMQHVCFWMPKAPNVNDHDTIRKRWVCSIERYLLKIFRLLQISGSQYPHASPPTLSNLLEKPQGEIRLGLLIHWYSPDPAQWDANTPEEIGGTNPEQGRTRHETVRITGIWSSLPIQITAELHAEYFTLSTRVELADTSFPGLFDPNERTYLRAKKALSLFNRILTKRFDSVATNGGQPRNNTPTRWRLRPVYYTLYYAIWHALQTELYINALKAISGPHELGQVIADFRGLIMRRGHDRDFVTLINPKSDPSALKFPTLQQISVGKPFGRRDLVPYADALLPFMQANPELALPVDGKPAFEQLEHTFSFFEDEGCIYASALNAQIPDPGNKRIRPLTYLLLACHGERWQLGRLIDRIHSMGTLRLAATYGLHDISVANDKLRIIEGELDELERLLPTHERIEDLTRRLLEQGRSTADAAIRVPGHLGYRTERSRYYLQQFHAHLKLSRIQRIGTFQSYPDLVRRRMGAAFDSIQLVRVRHTRIKEKIKDIELRIRTSQSVEHQRDLRAIQTKAELFFFLGVLPYYLYAYWSTWATEGVFDRLTHAKITTQGVLVASLLVGILAWLSAPIYRCFAQISNAAYGGIRYAKNILTRTIMRALEALRNSAIRYARYVVRVCQRIVAVVAISALKGTGIVKSAKDKLLSSAVRVQQRLKDMRRK